MQTKTTYSFDERDLREALVMYAERQNSGEGPLLDPNEIEFVVGENNAISATARETK